MFVALNDKGESPHVFLFQPHTRNVLRDTWVFRSVRLPQGCGRNQSVWYRPYDLDFYVSTVSTHCRGLRHPVWTMPDGANDERISQSRHSTLNEAGALGDRRSGIAERLHVGQPREAVLAAWGVLADGHKVLLHLAPGSKEDTASCRRDST